MGEGMMFSDGLMMGPDTGGSGGGFDSKKPVDFSGYGERQPEIDGLNERYSQITGRTLKEYVLGRMEQKPATGPLTGQDKERDQADKEFIRSLVPTQQTLLELVVAAEIAANRDGQEIPGRTPIVTEEEFFGLGKPVKTESRGGIGVEISAEERGRLQQQQEAEVDRQIEQLVRAEQDRAAQEGREVDMASTVDKIIKAVKTGGMIIAGAEVAEEFIEYLGENRPPKISEFKRWREGRHRPVVDAGGSTSAEVTPAEEEDEKPMMGWDEAMGELIRLCDQKVNRGLLPSEEKAVEQYRAVIEKRWEQFKGPESQIQNHEEWKDAVAGEIDQVIAADEKAKKEREGSLYPDTIRRDSPLVEVERSLDSVINGIVRAGKDGNPPPTEQELIQLGWYKGVKRNVQMAALKAELAIYEEMEIANKPEWKVRVEEIQKNLAELQVEVDMLNFGKGVRDRTKARLSGLAARYVDYLKTADPTTADKLKKAEEDRVAAEAARRTAEAASSTIKPEKNGMNYSPEDVIRLIRDKYWNNPNAVVDEDALHRALGEMEKKPEYAALAKLIEALIEVTKIVPESQTSIEEYANRINGLNIYKLQSFMDSIYKIEGIACVAEQWGFEAGGINRDKVDRYKKLSTETSAQFYLEIREKLARKLGKSGPDDDTVWLAFMFGNAFLKATGLPAELVDETSDGSPGYFHPDVPKWLWVARYPERAVQELLVRGGSRKSIANYDFISKHIGRNFQIAGEHWAKMLTSPFEFGPLALTTGALRSKEPLLTRIVRGRTPVLPPEFVNVPALLQMKQLAVIRKWMEQTVDLKEGSKSLLETHRPLFRTSFAADLAEEAVRELDDANELTGEVSVDGPKVSKVMGRKLMIRLGLDVNGNVKGQNPLTVEILREVFKGGYVYRDKKKNVQYEINLDRVIDYIYSARRDWAGMGGIFVKTDDYYLEEARRRFVSTSGEDGKRARQYVRQAAWGEISGTLSAYAYESLYKEAWTRPGKYRDKSGLMHEVGNFNSQMFDSVQTT